MLEANDMVEAKLAEIRERKIYEMKRMFAAKMHEGVGGLTNAEIEARKKAGYKRASEVLGDPRKEQLSAATKRYREEKASEKKKEEKKSWFPKIDMKKEKKISEETLDEAGLGDAARIVRSLSPEQKKLFMSGKKGNILSALKFRRSIATRKKESEQPEATPPETRETEPKKGIIRKTGKFVAKNVLGPTVGRGLSSLASDLSSIGTSKL